MDVVEVTPSSGKGLTFSNDVLEKEITITSSNPSIVARLSASDDWILFPGNETKEVSLSSKKVTVKVKINPEKLLAGSNNGSITINAGEQYFKLGVFVEFKPRIRVLPESLSFGLGEITKTIEVHSLESNATLVVSTSNNDQWIEALPKRIDVPKFDSANEETIGHITVTVDRNKITNNIETYKSEVLLSSLEGEEVISVPVEMYANPSGAHSFVIQPFRFSLSENPKLSGNQLILTMDVENTGSESNLPVVFYEYSQEGNAYQSCAIDIAGYAHIVKDVSFENSYSNSYAFASREKKSVTVTLDGFDIPSVYSIKHISIPSNLGTIIFKNVEIPGRQKTDFTFEQITQSEKDILPDGLEFSILHSYKDSSGDIILDCLVENKSLIDSTIQLYSNSYYSSLYVDSGEVAHPSSIEIGTFVSNGYGSSRKVFLPKGERIRGRIVKNSGTDINGIQYLRIPLFSDAPNDIIGIKNIEIENCTARAFPNAYANSSCNLDGVTITGCTVTNDKAEISLLIKNTSNQEVKYSFDKDNRYYITDTGKKNNWSYSISIDNTDLLVPPGVTCCNEIRIEDCDLEILGFQTICIPISYEPNNAFSVSSLILKDIPLPGKTLPDYPWIECGNNGLVKAYYASCEPEGDSVKTLLKFENISGKDFSSFDIASGAFAIDELGYYHKLQDGLSVVQLPSGGYVYGTLVVSDVSETVGCLQFTRLPILTGTENSELDLRDIPIGERMPHEPFSAYPDGSCSLDNVILLGCSQGPTADSVYITFCINNDTEVDQLYTISKENRLFVDEQGNTISVYNSQIKLTLGLNSSSYDAVSSLVPAHSLCQGTITITGIPELTAGFQTLDFPISIDGQSEHFSFENLQIEGRSVPEIQWNNCGTIGNGFIDVFFSECKDEGDYTSLLLKFENKGDVKCSIKVNKGAIAYDNWGYLEASQTSYSNTLYPGLFAYTKVLFSKAFSDADRLSLLNIPIELNGESTMLSIRDVPIDKRVHKAIPVIVTHEGAVDFLVSRCYDNGEGVVLEYLVENNHAEDDLSFGAIASQNIFTDNNRIDYQAKSISLAGNIVYETSAINLPQGIKVRGTILLPSIEDISSYYNSASLCYIVDGAADAFNTGVITIEERDIIENAFHSFATLGPFDLSLIDCYEKEGFVIIDYIANNTGSSDLELEISNSAIRVFDDMGNVYSISKAILNGKSSTYPNALIKSSKAVRGQFYIANFDPVASIIKKIKLNYETTSYHYETVYSDREISVSGRERQELPSSQVSYDIVTVPEKITFELISVDYINDSARVFFRITNQSSQEKSLKWDLNDTDSYAIDEQGIYHYITEAAIGDYVRNREYFSFVIPGYTMVKGYFVIPDVNSGTHSLSRILLDYFDGNRYELTNITW